MIYSSGIQNLFLWDCLPNYTRMIESNQLRSQSIQGFPKKKHGRNNPCAPISQSVLGHNSRRTPGLHPLLLQLMIYAMQTCIFRLAFLTNSQTSLLAKQMDRFSGRGVDFFFYFTGKKISDVQIFRKSVERVYFYLFFQRNFHF